jgi:hypothetical protein
MKAIMTKYHGPTNTRGSRVSASDLDHNKITLSWDDSLDHDENHDAAAIALCRKMEINSGLVRGRSQTGNVYVFDEDCNRVEV